MLWHVLGYTTVVADAIGGIGAAWWLYRTATRPWTWQRPLHVPKFADDPGLADDASVGVV